MTTRWGLTEEATYDRARDALGLSVKRLDELLNGITWLIARDADGEHCVEIDGIRLAKASVPGSDDLLRVWFTLDYDSMQAHLISVDIERQDDSGDNAW